MTAPRRAAPIRVPFSFWVLTGGTVRPLAGPLLSHVLKSPGVVATLALCAVICHALRT
jgi:hypothetical protein